MIRVLIEIVPLGVEERTRVIDYVLIGNITPDQTTKARYLVRHHAHVIAVNHDRRDGALALAHTALHELLEHYPPQRIERIDTPFQVLTEAIDEAPGSMRPLGVTQEAPDAPNRPARKAVLSLGRKPPRRRRPTRQSSS